MNVEPFYKFIVERQRIYVRRQQGLPKPWTQDEILQRYRFCNVLRENDTVTQWIAKNWREPYGGDSHIWFLMCVARLINWPDTLSELTPALFKESRAVDKSDRSRFYQIDWKPEKFVQIMHERKRRGDKVFTGAYMVRAEPSAPGEDKADYLAHKVLTPLWHRRQTLRPSPEAEWTIWHELLESQYGFGSFMAAQVVADVKYAEPYFQRAKDWFSFAAMGPGSARGMNRVLGRDKDTSWGRDNHWLDQLGSLYEAVAPKFKKEFGIVLHAQDVQNCLCEFDKYERVRLGEGRPRSLYPGV